MLIITPKTRILDLIEAYPELEQKLFEMSPAFRKLQNPILRKTVARVTTLQQAALVGNIPVERMINELRRAAGQEHLEDRAEGRGQKAENQEEVKRDMKEKSETDFDLSKISMSLDAREMLNRGEHPVAQVMADLHTLPAGDVYELVAPFYPAPLIDKAAGIGFDHRVEQKGAEEFKVYFRRRGE